MKFMQLLKNCEKLRLYIKWIHEKFIIPIMSIDVFGRTLIKAREVHQGPAGIGFSLTKVGDFDIGKHRLCNVASAIDPTDAVNLDNLTLVEEKLNKALSELEDRFSKQVRDLKLLIQNKTV